MVSAKSRCSRSERGVALFIVVMVITLLAAVGLFAARSATWVDTAAGYSRQASQAIALAGYANRFAAAELGHGRARWYIDQMRAAGERCPSNRNTTQPLPCYKLDDLDVSRRIDGQLLAQGVADAEDRTPIQAQTSAAAGSLGPPLGVEAARGGTEAVFMVELLDAFQTQGMPGMDRGGGPNRFINVQMTVTGWSQVRTSTGAANNPWCSTAAPSTGASVQAVRAHITVPNQPSQ
jgi:Tfp pilus assembly protein PilX